MKNTIILLLLAGILFACDENHPLTKMTNKLAPVDSLITNWNNNWNARDSAAISDLFETDALVIDDNMIATNSGEISAKWIQPHYKNIRNMRTTKLQEWSSEDRAGYTGQYELDYTVNDTLTVPGKGIFTINWKKGENGEWKITTADIHSLAQPE